MYDINERKKIWNKRLKKCIKDSGYTQESLACAINKKYEKDYTQNTISRWQHLGDAKNGVKGFPDFENMLILANFFAVDVGYLTGETDNETFEIEKASAYLGLNPTAIKNIRNLTAPESRANFYMSLDMREALNEFLSAIEFKKFFSCLHSLYVSSQAANRLQEPEFENYELARDFINDLNESVRFQRFELNEAFVLLMNAIYPTPTLDDLTIKEE